MDYALSRYGVRYSFFKDGLDIKATLRNISQSKSNTIRAFISLLVSNASKNLRLYCEQTCW